MDQQLSLLYLALTKPCPLCYAASKQLWLVYPSIDKPATVKTRLVMTSWLIPIGLLQKFRNRPKPPTKRFAQHESIAMVLHALEEPGKTRTLVLCAESGTSPTFPRDTSFLTCYPEEWTMNIVKNTCCPWYEICPNDMPSFTHSSWYHHHQQRVHLLTPAVDKVGLSIIAECPNFTDTHAGFNIYSCMNVDWLYQLLKGLFNSYPWEWIVGSLKNIYGQQKG